MNDAFENHVQIGVEVGGFAGAAVAGDSVVNGVVELFFAGGQLQEEVGNFVQDFGDASGGLVDFVNNDNGLQIEAEGFLQNEFGLRHGALLSVDNEEHTVGHAQSPLDLARKVGVAGSVDDVDFLAVVKNRGLLGGDGDTPLVLLIERVHDQGLLHFGLVVAKSVRLLEQAVDQGGFAVVNVSDNGNVADFFWIHSYISISYFGGNARGGNARGLHIDILAIICYNRSTGAVCPTLGNAASASFSLVAARLPGKKSSLRLAFCLCFATHF